MSHFYGTLQGSRGEATRCGTANSGITTEAAGWGGCIRVELYKHSKTSKDMFRIFQTPWKGEGVSEVIAEGVVGENIKTKLPMKRRVTWVIDSDADSPVDAAKQALAIQRNPESIATHFTVEDCYGNIIQVDLDEVNNAS